MYLFSGGTTIHRGLGFKYGTNALALSDEKLNRLRKEYEDLRVCIIDEISMVGADRFYDINKRFRIINNNFEIFGGVANLCFGDLMQLPPPSARKVFLQPLSLQNQALFYSDENLWKNCKSVVLKVNHRQGEGNEWTLCLNRIRTADKLTPEDAAVLETRKIKNFPEKDFGDALHTFYTNEEVEEVNDIKLDELTDPQIIHEAVIETSESYSPRIKSYGVIDDTSFLKTLKVKVGARVMLIWNVSIWDKLVNGMTGSVIELLFNFRQVNGEVRRTLKAIVVKFDNETVGEETREMNWHLSESIRSGGGVPIFTSSSESSIPGNNKCKESNNQRIEIFILSLGKNPNSKHGAKIKITQFPLRLAWAFTAHKLQGVTIAKGTDMVCHGYAKKPLPKGMAYVMLSRCESIENVFLDDKFKIEDVRCEAVSMLATKRLEESDIAPIIQKQKFDIFYMNIR